MRTSKANCRKCKKDNSTCGMGLAYRDGSLDCPNYQEKKPTNFDRIKAMSVEEMAEFLMNVNNAYAMDCMCGMSECKHPDIDDNCAICFKEYLESEVEE